MQKVNAKELLAGKSHVFDSISDLAIINSLPEGNISVKFPGGNIDSFFIKNPTSENLVVLFSGARDPNRHPLPKFDRWSWSDKFGASILCISDPTLALDDKNLNIGWYMGTEGTNYMPHIAAWVRQVALLLGIPTNKIVTYGSSAGGFASIMLTAALKNSIAIAINPQLDVFKYYPKFVDQYMALAFPNKTRSELSAHDVKRFLAIEAIVNEPDARFIIAQNIQDKFHYAKHYGQLCKKVGIPLSHDIGAIRRVGNISVLLFDSPNGHGSEPEDIVPILKAEALLSS